MAESPGAGYRPSKVERLIETYEFSELGAELEARWTGSGEQRDSLRELAEYVNRRVLATGMRREGVETLDGDVENVYRLLTDDGVSRGSRIEARRRLERAGVDVERIGADFVSRQAVHTYLTDRRGVSYDTQSEEETASDPEYIHRLVERTAAVTETKLETRHRDGTLGFEDPAVLVDVQVLCENCGTQAPLEDVLAGSSCDCSDESS